MSLYLVSGSPRRKEILNRLGIDFVPASHQVDEDAFVEPHPERRVKALAAAKLKSFLFLKEQAQTSLDLPALAVDTLLAFRGRPLEKAYTREEARRMLKTLSGRRHEVLTACAFQRPGELDCHLHLERAFVWFRPLTEEILDWYLSTGEWQDAAGAYRLQGCAEVLIKRIEGLPSCIVGLPIPWIYDMMAPLCVERDKASSGLAVK